MKDFLSQYGFAILGAIVVILLIAMCTPIGSLIKEQISGIVTGFSDKTETKMYNMGAGKEAGIAFAQVDENGKFKVDVTTDSSNDVLGVSYRVKDQHGNWSEWRELGNLSVGEKEHSGEFTAKIENGNKIQVRFTDKGKEDNLYYESNLVEYTGESSLVEKIISTSSAEEAEEEKLQLKDFYTWKDWREGSGLLNAPADADITADLYIGEEIGYGSLACEDFLIFNKNANEWKFSAKIVQNLSSVSSYIEIYDKSGKYEGKVYSPVDHYGYCFVAGTKILMANGTHKNIEEIKIGDAIVAYDYFNKKFFETKVKDTTISKTNYISNIELENGIILRCTPSHPILDANGSWKSVNPQFNDGTKEFTSTILSVGDEVVTKNGISRVKSIVTEHLNETILTYNLSVEADLPENHTFVADGVIVHNAECKTTGSGTVVTDPETEEIEENGFVYTTSISEEILEGFMPLEYVIDFFAEPTIEEIRGISWSAEDLNLIELSHIEVSEDYEEEMGDIKAILDYDEDFIQFNEVIIVITTCEEEIVFVPDINEEGNVELWLPSEIIFGIMSDPNSFIAVLAS